MFNKPPGSQFQLPPSNMFAIPTLGTAEPGNRIRCPQCPEEFFTLASYKWHLSRSHMQFSCTICGKTFRSRGGLGFHMEAHRGRNFVCPVCDFRFKHKHHLKDHVTNVHKMLLCPVCYLTFDLSDTDRLRYHLETCRK